MLGAIPYASHAQQEDSDLDVLLSSGGAESDAEQRQPPPAAPPYDRTLEVVPIRDAAAEPMRPRPPSRLVEEIVVTARGKDETLLDIPISVSTIGAQEFEAAGVKAMSDVAQMVPNLYMDEQATGQRISVRGLGNDTLGASFDSSTGLSIDGLYFGRTRWFEVGLFDVEQIEILRGPQGVYFGKNTTAGLVNIRSKMPGDDRSGHFRGGYESAFGEKFIEVGLNTPVTSGSGLRVAAQVRQADGYIRNIALEKEEPGNEQGMARLTYVWRPNDWLSVIAKTQYANSKRNGQTQQLLACTSLYRTLLAVNSSPEDCVLDERRTQGAYVPAGYIDEGDDGEILENVSFSQALSIEWHLSEHKVSSTTGFHDQQVAFTVDPDFSDIRLGFTSRPEDFRQFSQELRLESRFDGGWNYLLGAYYDDTSLDAKAIVDLNALAAAGGLGGGILEQLIPVLSGAASTGGSAFKRMTQDNDSVAFFGELRIDLTRTLELALGGRYTNEKRRALLIQELGGLGNPFDDDPVGETFWTAIQWSEIFRQDSRRSRNFSPSAILRWAYADEGRAYLSYVEGFKSGGFDLDVVSQDGGRNAPIDGFEFGDEQVRSYEVGLKQTFFDSQLRVSAAAYRSEYTDLQVQTTFGFLQVATLNAAQATLQGLELDTQLSLGSGWDINGSLGVSSARYDAFDGAPCYGGQSSADGCDGGEQDVSGKVLPLAPDLSAALGITWHAPFYGDTVLTLGSDVVYRDEVILALDRDPLAYDDALTLLNLFIGLADSADRWSVSVTGKNVLGERYQTGYLDVTLLAGNGGGTQGLPRTILTQFKYNF